MSGHIPWVERRFSFDFPAGIHPELIERLRGAPMRAEAMTRGLPREVLTRRDGPRWSIQEHVGHLADLDRATFLPRLAEFEAGAAVLTPADMKNRATEDAGHNARAIQEVVAAFRATRERITTRLEAQDGAFFERSALHERLNKAMRVVDLLAFKAEHDDYHLARVRELIRRWGTR
jgi:uncharacterized damage-inducible protein DinB